jgi:DNA polymerase sigma
VDRSHEALWSAIKGAFTNCFDGDRIVGAKYEGAIKLIDQIAKHERKLQLLIRSMTEGVISERDRLLQYNLGEFYQELSLFIEEADARKKVLDKLKNKTS